MSVDCARAAAIIQQVIAGAVMPSGDLTDAIGHAATCGTCAARFDLADVAACADVEDQLSEAARLQAAGEAPVTRWPELAEHLAACTRCQAALQDLAEEPTMESRHDASGPARSRSMIERALTSALAAPEPIVRLRACQRLATFAHLGRPSRVALTTAAEHDPDAGVRAAADHALAHAARSVAQRWVQPVPEPEPEMEPEPEDR